MRTAKRGGTPAPRLSGLMEGGDGGGAADSGGTLLPFCASTSAELAFILAAK
jgi:hypothetical protein